MPYPIERKLVVAISSSAVFDMREADAIFRESGEKSYRQPQTTMNPVSVLNLFNLLFWGVDAAFAALWKYDPNYCDVKLDRAGSR